MGITTPLSTNPAMTIGGLKVGVTPLDMAHAYETIAHGGERVSGSLVSDSQPVGIQEVSAGGRTLSDGHHTDRNAVRLKRVLPPEVASTETSVLETVLQYGTARAAAIGQFAAGKTGTTSNYGDAWFVGRQVHGGRLGRLPQQSGADDDRLRRHPGARGDLPSFDLAQLHALGDPSGKESRKRSRLGQGDEGRLGCAERHDGLRWAGRTDRLQRSGGSHDARQAG
jgi:hypothetical protein